MRLSKLHLLEKHVLYFCVILCICFFHPWWVLNSFFSSHLACPRLIDKQKKRPRLEAVEKQLVTPSLRTASLTASGWIVWGSPLQAAWHKKSCDRSPIPTVIQCYSMLFNVIHSEFCHVYWTHAPHVECSAQHSRVSSLWASRSGFRGFNPQPMCLLWAVLQAVSCCQKLVRKWNYSSFPNTFSALFAVNLCKKSFTNWACTPACAPWWNWFQNSRKNIQKSGMHLIIIIIIIIIILNPDVHLQSSCSSACLPSRLWVAEVRFSPQLPSRCNLHHVVVASCAKSNLRHLSQPMAHRL